MMILIAVENGLNKVEHLFIFSIQDRKPTANLKINAEKMQIFLQRSSTI